MHELSIAQSLLNIVVQEAEKHGVDRITKVGVQVGKFTHVVPHALTFCFDMVKEGTVAADAELKVEEVPMAGWCQDCQKEFVMADPTAACPQCGGNKVQLIGGRELQVAYIETPDPDDQAPGAPAQE